MRTGGSRPADDREEPFVWDVVAVAFLRLHGIRARGEQYPINGVGTRKYTWRLSEETIFLMVMGWLPWM